MTSAPNSSGHPVEPPRLGRLEARVMLAIWAHDGPLMVADIHPSFPDAAYTTIMTTTDRLFQKGMLRRTKPGRAYVYEAVWTRETYEAARAEHSLRTAFAANASPAALTTLMSALVDIIGDRDRALLETLESLCRARRESLDDDKEPPT